MRDKSHLQRIEQRNAQVNAFVDVYAEDALEAAREADRAVERGEELGALHGVPVGINDNYAVVTGLVAQHEGIAADRTRLLAGHSFLVGLLGAAQRLAGIGHTETQAVLTALRPVVASVCAEHAEADLAKMQSFAPRIELMGMAHERAQRRLFVS